MTPFKWFSFWCLCGLALLGSWWLLRRCWYKGRKTCRWNNCRGTHRNCWSLIQWYCIQLVVVFCFWCYHWKLSLKLQFSVCVIRVTSFVLTIRHFLLVIHLGLLSTQNQIWLLYRYWVMDILYCSFCCVSFRVNLFSWISNSWSKFQWWLARRDPFSFKIKCYVCINVKILSVIVEIKFIM